MLQDEEKPKLRSSRTSFLTQLLKRPSSRPQSLRYEDTTAAELISQPHSQSQPQPKIFKFGRTNSEFDSKANSDENMAAPSRDETPLIIRFYDPAVNAEDARRRTLDDILDWEDPMLERCHDYIQMLFPLPEGSPFNFRAPIITRKVMDEFHNRPELRARLRQSFVRMMEFYGFSVSGELGFDEGETRDEGEDEGEGEKGLGVESKPDTASDAVADAQPEQPQVTWTETAGEVRDETPEHPQTAPMEEELKVDQTDQASNDEKAVSGSPSQAQTSKSPPSFQPPAKPTYLPLITSKGVPRVDGPCVITRAPHWRSAFRNWAIRIDHNHLRMTRILRSLRILGLQDECVKFYGALREVFNDPEVLINERTMMYWRRAVGSKVWEAPDGEYISWLRRWAEEEERAAALAREGDGEEEGLGQGKQSEGSDKKGEGQTEASAS